jgi:hypothetical protein
VEPAPLVAEAEAAEPDADAVVLLPVVSRTAVLLSFVASAWKAAKLRGPDSSLLIENTMPAPQ